jgi:hypothetical protein
VTKYAICFDFPEAEGEPLFAGITHDGTMGFAPTLRTARFFGSETVAERVLANSYGNETRQYAVVVEVQP